MDSLIHQLRKVAIKSNIQFKLAAGLFYTKKGFISMGYNSSRTYLNKQITPSIHAEHDAIYNCKSRFRKIKTKNLKMIVIRISATDQLLNSKPCLNCTHLIREYGIRKIYYINEENKLVFDRVDQLHSYRLQEPGISLSTSVWFHRTITTKSSPSLSYLQSLLAEQPDLFSKKMGKKIECLRLQKNWSQEELANKMSITIDIIKNIEKGTEKYNVIIVNKFKRCFGYFEW